MVVFVLATHRFVSREVRRRFRESGGLEGPFRSPREPAPKRADDGVLPPLLLGFSLDSGDLQLSGARFFRFCSCGKSDVSQKKTPEFPSSCRNCLLSCPKMTRWKLKCARVWGTCPTLSNGFVYFVDSLPISELLEKGCVGAKKPNRSPSGAAPLVQLRANKQGVRVGPSRWCGQYCALAWTTSRPPTMRR